MSSRDRNLPSVSLPQVWTPDIWLLLVVVFVVVVVNIYFNISLSFRYPTWCTSLINMSKMLLSKYTSTESCLFITEWPHLWLDYLDYLLTDVGGWLVMWSSLSSCTTTAFNGTGSSTHCWTNYKACRKIELCYKLHMGLNQHFPCWKVTLFIVLLMNTIY